MPVLIIRINHVIVVPCRVAELAVYGFAFCGRFVFKPNTSFLV